MARKHYHVHCGMNGYLPNASYYADTLTQAREIAKAEAADSREDGYKVYGSARAGYYSLGRTSDNLFMHIAIDECYEDDCNESEDNGF